MHIVSSDACYYSCDNDQECCERDGIAACCEDDKNPVCCGESSFIITNWYVCNSSTSCK